MDTGEQKGQFVREILNEVEIVQNELAGMRQEASQDEIPNAYREIIRYQMKTLDYGLQAHACGREWFLALLREIESEDRDGSRNE